MTTLKSGQSYDLPDELARQYITVGYAYEDKMLDPPEVK